MTPLSPALAASRPFLHRTALAFGTVLGGITLSAGYQLAYDEGKDLIMRLRSGFARRRRRNEHIIISLAGTQFPPTMLEQLFRARDRFSTALQILATAGLEAEEKERLRHVLMQASAF